MRNFRNLHWLRAFALIAWGTTQLYGQADTAQISGFVRDATASVIPGVVVTITNEATQLTR